MLLVVHVRQLQSWLVIFPATLIASRAALMRTPSIDAGREFEGTIPSSIHHLDMSALPLRFPVESLSVPFLGETFLIPEDTFL